MKFLLYAMLIAPYLSGIQQEPHMTLLNRLLAGQPAQEILKHYPAVDFNSQAFKQRVIAAEAAVVNHLEAFQLNQVLSVGTEHYSLGTFSTPNIGELKARLGQSPSQQGAQLSILLGASTFTDIQYLEAHSDGATVFQLASQFNGLEAPSAEIVPVSAYFGDRTQGPLGVLPAFSGALLRHYAAPGPDGKPFIQSDQQQLNFLADVLPPTIGRMQSGYLLSQNITQPEQLSQNLTVHFDQIRIGLHRDLPVVGYPNKVDQVLTSTLAGGSYSHSHTQVEPWLNIQRQLLRAAYLGTLLAAADAGKTKVVLTAIGGGVFANPHALIWESLLWALDEASYYLKQPLHVILNLRSFEVPTQTLKHEAKRRGGELIQFF